MTEGHVSANRRELVDRAEKAELVTELKGVFQTANTVVVAHYAGLTVAQMQTLRKQARQADTKVRVAKNRLAKIALEGTDAAPIGPLQTLCPSSASTTSSSPSTCTRR